MTKIDLLFDQFLGPLVLVAVLTACLFGLNSILLRYPPWASRHILHRQVIMLGVTLLAIFLLIVLLPISDELRGQIMGLIGLLLSATIALSSTTFLGNALAGILLRSIRSFRTGDFIYIENQFGRVSDRGLFHIEIQTEDSDLVTLPNLYVTNNPVKVSRETGTIVSSEVSLGYDWPHHQVEGLLVEAANRSGLQDPFVYILKLGDFSILYRVNGMLLDVKRLLSVRSQLNAAILDSLHRAGIEIVSPNFMNTREVSGLKFTAQSVLETAGPIEAQEPEGIIFDKAEKAASVEEIKAIVTEIETKLETLKKEAALSESDKKAGLMAMIDRLQKQHAQLDQKMSNSKKEIENEKSSE